MYIIILKIWFINLGTLGLRVLFLAASGQPDLRAAGRPAAAATADQPDVWRQPAGLAGQHVGPTARQPARPSPARYGSHQHYQQQQHQQQQQQQYVQQQQQYEQKLRLPVKSVPGNNPIF